MTLYRGEIKWVSVVPFGLKNYKWQQVGSMNGLKDVYEKYCYLGEVNIQKDARDTFVKGTADDVIRDFQVYQEFQK
jgi:hypothetical protein